MLRRYSLFLLLIVVCLSPSSAWAWGCSGHETVALIAQLEMNKLDTANQTHVLDQVNSLLALQARPYGGRFCSDLGLDPIAYYATWADDHRAQVPSTGNWHFWDIPLTTAAGAEGQFCSQGCVIQALNDQIAILKDTTRSAADRSVALLFVIHLVGDMHQPLHTSDDNDRGGNCVPVFYLGKGPRSTDANGDFELNLHGIWDTQLVEAAGNINRKSTDASSEIKSFASDLFTANSAAIDQTVKGPVDLVGWANAAHQIAIRDPYADLAPPISPAAQVKPVVHCSDGGTSAAFLRRHETVDANYVSGGKSDIEGQLSLAGGRLAAILYASLGNPPQRH